MQTQKINTDELFAIVADSQRRSLLRYLQRNGTTSIDSLTERLAGENASEDTASVLRIELHHTQLPRLEKAGLLDYDPTTGQIEPYGVSDERLSSLLEMGVESQ